MVSRRVARGLRLIAWSCIVAVGLLQITSACGSQGSTGSDPVPRGGTAGSSNSLEWAGFNNTNRLELMDVNEDAGIDRFVQFVLRGSPADIDEALVGAEFSGDTENGIGTRQPPLPSFDPSRLSNVHSGEDVWTNPLGHKVHRQYVRGSRADGTEVVHVWAFTT